MKIPSSVDFKGQGTQPFRAGLTFSGRPSGPRGQRRSNAFLPAVCEGAFRRIQHHVGEKTSANVLHFYQSSMASLVLLISGPGAPFEAQRTSINKLVDIWNAPAVAFISGLLYAT